LSFKLYVEFYVPASVSFSSAACVALFNVLNLYPKKINGKQKILSLNILLAGVRFVPMGVPILKPLWISVLEKK
jgi:hypothetical protein